MLGPVLEGDLARLATLGPRLKPLGSLQDRLHIGLPVLLRRIRRQARHDLILIVLELPQKLVTIDLSFLIKPETTAARGSIAIQNGCRGAMGKALMGFPSCSKGQSFTSPHPSAVSMSSCDMFTPRWSIDMRSKDEITS